MIDIHTHILPEIDDGAASLEETQQMMALAAEDGITEMVATPHCDSRFEFDSERCGEKLRGIRRACAEFPQLYLGCELHLTFENVERVLARPRNYTLNGRDCLLVELPDWSTAAGVETGLKACHRRGLRTVIAHPERNLSVQRNPDILTRLLELGCYFQVTAQSLFGVFGTAAQRSATRMLKQHQVHFVASDCHGARQRKPLLRGAYREIARDWGTPAADLLFILNPRSAVHGQPIQWMGHVMGESPVGRLLGSINLFGKARRSSEAV
jgi:protein-tyrosine phosphatase